LFLIVYFNTFFIFIKFCSFEILLDINDKDDKSLFFIKSILLFHKISYSFSSSDFL